MGCQAGFVARRGRCFRLLRHEYLDVGNATKFCQALDADLATPTESDVIEDILTIARNISSFANVNKLAVRDLVKVLSRDH